MKAKAFLEYSGKHYEENKKKWAARLKKQGLKFDEDIYQDTIIKVYSHINDDKEYNGNMDAYWYQAFINNIRRDSKYSYHKKDDSIDVLEYLDEFPVEDRPILLSDIEDNFNILTPIEKHIILLHYVSNLTYSEIEELTDVKDVRYKIRGILKKIRGLNK